ncbi:MAG TPA: TIGR00341 family protein [Candidatus Binatia bacterium]|jgi:uncharacterized hydrophobic protein (TIGR00271 family)|nr:TIGR00341 family protein [Candidatus Binatia bacterium]
MRVIDGVLPEGKIWRAMVLFSHDQDPGLSWYFALQLARASNGEAVGAAILPEAASENAVQVARTVLKKAQADATDADNVHTLLIVSKNFRQALVELIEKADIDLLLADGDDPEWQRLERLPCAAAIIRGGAYRAYREAQYSGGEDGNVRKVPYRVKRILVPAAGGPNAAQAVSVLLPLTPEVDITALYVVPDYLGDNEVAHGHARLRQMAKFVDADDRTERRVIQTGTVTQGIVEEASKEYGLVVIGASRESTIDRALFGDVVGAVVRESKTPVMVFWEPSSPVNNLWRDLAWRLQSVIPRLGISQRTDVYVRVRRSARPNIDFFVLIGLSTLIASLGLLLSSPAVVIGAMLVAPLMSPIIGAGMAIVLGNPRFLRLSLGAVAKGTILAIALGALTGLLQVNEPLTPEILSRTQPTLFDLGVAVFAGLAGAYALAHSEAAAALPGVAISAALVPPLAAVGIAFATGNLRESAGALLLYSTNLVAIVAASVVVFLSLGFRPSHTQKAQRAIQQRTVRIAVVLLALITVVLGATTLSLASDASLNARINELVETQTNAIEGVEFAGLEIENLSNPQEPLTLLLTVRATHAIAHSTVEELRNQIGSELQPALEEDREIAMTLTVIRVTKLDPEVPPTSTPTPESSPTPTATSTTPSEPVPEAMQRSGSILLTNDTPLRPLGLRDIGAQL